MPKEKRIVKAKCRLSDKKFIFQMEKFGSEWKATNMVECSDEEYASVATSLNQESYYLSDALIACPVCGSRKVGGCPCTRAQRARKYLYCRKSNRFDFKCAFCSELEIDRSRNKSPYTASAGISNIPAEAFDAYGNPEGSEYDLAQDGAFVGYRIVILSIIKNRSTRKIDEAKFALKQKGFEVIEINKVPTPAELRELLYVDGGKKTQFWLIPNSYIALSQTHADIIVKFFNEGHGVYLWGDNDPMFADTNLLTRLLFGTEMSGNYRADKVLGVQTAPGEPGIVANHLITTGVVNFYEGITVAHFELKQKGLTELMRASDKQILAAYYDQDGKRAIVDGGYTRLVQKWNTAGTSRYVTNAAAWLANIERFGYEQ